MQIIWHPEAAEQLKKTHTLLELESFDTEKGTLQAWCLIPPEQLVNDMPQLDNLKNLHQGFLRAYSENNQKLCQDIAEHLIGRFGGELDSFYQEILQRFKQST